MPLAIAALDWSAVGDVLAALAAEGWLEADALWEATRELAASRRSDVGGLEALERRLAAAGDPRLRRLGLAALAGLSVPPRGWDAERLDRLRRYRADGALMVAAAAQLTLPTEELD